MLTSNIVITKDLFDDFRKQTFKTDEERKTAGSRLISYLIDESFVNKAAGSQLVKHPSFY